MTIGGRLWGQIPGVVPIFLAVAAIGLLIQETTALGSRLYLVGSNIRAAYLSGIPVDRVLILAYTLSGATAGIAGVVLLARQQRLCGSNLHVRRIGCCLIGRHNFPGRSRRHHRHISRSVDFGRGFQSGEYSRPQLQSAACRKGRHYYWRGNRLSATQPYFLGSWRNT
jgi:hypothetical protein